LVPFFFAILLNRAKALTAPALLVFVIVADLPFPQQRGWRDLF
jgi:hypothetical protein